MAGIKIMDDVFPDAGFNEVKRTRSGRIVIPPLASWTGERVFCSLDDESPPTYVKPSLDNKASYLFPSSMRERIEKQFLQETPQAKGNATSQHFKKQSTQSYSSQKSLAPQQWGSARMEPRKQTACRTNKRNLSLSNSNFPVKSSQASKKMGEMLSVLTSVAIGANKVKKSAHNSALNSRYNKSFCQADSSDKDSQEHSRDSMLKGNKSYAAHDSSDEAMNEGHSLAKTQNITNKKVRRASEESESTSYSSTRGESVKDSDACVVANNAYYKQFAECAIKTVHRARDLCQKQEHKNPNHLHRDVMLLDYPHQKQSCDFKRKQQKRLDRNSAENKWNESSAGKQHLNSNTFRALSKAIHQPIFKSQPTKNGEKSSHSSKTEDGDVNHVSSKVKRKVAIGDRSYFSELHSSDTTFPADDRQESSPQKLQHRKKYLHRKRDVQEKAIFLNRTGTTDGQSGSDINELDTYQSEMPVGKKLQGNSEKLKSDAQRNAHSCDFSENHRSSSGQADKRKVHLIDSVLLEAQRSSLEIPLSERNDNSALQEQPQINHMRNPSKGEYSVDEFHVTQAKHADFRSVRKSKNGRNSNHGCGNHSNQSSSYDAHHIPEGEKCSGQKGQVETCQNISFSGNGEVDVQLVDPENRSPFCHFVRRNLADEMENCSETSCLPSSKAELRSTSEKRKRHPSGCDLEQKKLTQTAVLKRDLVCDLGKSPRSVRRHVFHASSSDNAVKQRKIHPEDKIFALSSPVVERTPSKNLCERYNFRESAGISPNRDFKSNCAQRRNSMTEELESLSSMCKNKSKTNSKNHNHEYSGEFNDIPILSSGSTNTFKKNFKGGAAAASNVDVLNPARKFCLSVERMRLSTPLSPTYGSKSVSPKGKNNSSKGQSLTSDPKLGLKSSCHDKMRSDHLVSNIVAPDRICSLSDNSSASSDSLCSETNKSRNNKLKCMSSHSLGNNHEMGKGKGTHNFPGKSDPIGNTNSPVKHSKKHERQMSSKGDSSRPAPKVGMNSSLDLSNVSNSRMDDSGSECSQNEEDAIFNDVENDDLDGSCLNETFVLPCREDSENIDMCSIRKHTSKCIPLTNKENELNRSVRENKESGTEFSKWNKQDTLMKSEVPHAQACNISRKSARRESPISGVANLGNTVCYSPDKTSIPAGRTKNTSAPKNNRTLKKHDRDLYHDKKSEHDGPNSVHKNVCLDFALDKHGTFPKTPDYDTRCSKSKADVPKSRSPSIYSIDGDIMENISDVTENSKSSLKGTKYNNHINKPTEELERSSFFHSVTSDSADDLSDSNNSKGSECRSGGTSRNVNIPKVFNSHCYSLSNSLHQKLPDSAFQEANLGRVNEHEGTQKQNECASAQKKDVVANKSPSAFVSNSITTAVGSSNRHKNSKGAKKVSWRDRREISRSVPDNDYGSSDDEESGCVLRCYSSGDKISSCSYENATGKKMEVQFDCFSDRNYDENSENCEQASYETNAEKNDRERFVSPKSKESVHHTQHRSSSREKGPSSKSKDYSNSRKRVILKSTSDNNGSLKIPVHNQHKRQNFENLKALISDVKKSQAVPGDDNTFFEDRSKKTTRERIENRVQTTSEMDDTHDRDLNALKESSSRKTRERTVPCSSIFQKHSSEVAELESSLLDGNKTLKRNKSASKMSFDGSDDSLIKGKNMVVNNIVTQHEKHGGEKSNDFNTPTKRTFSSLHKKRPFRMPSSTNSSSDECEAESGSNFRRQRKKPKRQKLEKNAFEESRFRRTGDNIQCRKEVESSVLIVAALPFGAKRSFGFDEKDVEDYFFSDNDSDDVYRNYV